jgi:[methyl-Co(III) methanol-specific corrinoid protein]:coenzyme M methyltransferase
MAELRPKERIRRFFTREPVDTMPCFSGMGMVTMQAIQKLGIRFAQVHSSAQYMARSALSSARIFGFDAVVVPYDMCTIPEALGRGVSLYDHAEEVLYPTVPSKWEKLDQVNIPDDFMMRGRMPVVDEAIRMMISESDGQLGVGTWVLGPFTMAGQLIELDVLLKGVRKDRERVEAFLSRMTDLVIQVARHYQDLGVDYMNIREMGSGTDIISPRVWKDMVQSNLQKIFSALKSPKILHICGSTDLIIEMMNECGADALSVDQKNNVVETRKRLGDDVILLGNFDPYGTLVKMEVSQVGPVIKQCIVDGVDAVWPGCDLWPDLKQENLMAYVATIREHGRKPTPAVGRI